MDISDTEEFKRELKVGDVATFSGYFKPDKANRSYTGELQPFRYTGKGKFQPVMD